MSNLVLGQWNVICDQCGVKRKSSEVTKRWDGLIVCKTEVRPGCFEHRHPQDFVRTVVDDQSVAFTRPEATDQFITVNYISDAIGVQENTLPPEMFSGETSYFVEGYVDEDYFEDLGTL